MSKKDQSRGHNWKKRVKDWLLIPQPSTVSNAHDVSLDELARHHTRTDCWMAINGDVFDVSRFVPYHPGGPKILEMYAGRDASTAFARNHASAAVLEAISNFRVGKLLDGGEGPDRPEAPSTSAAAASSNNTAIREKEAPQQRQTRPNTTSQPSQPASTQPALEPEPSETDLAAEAMVGLSRPQLANVVVRSQLFPEMAPDVLSAAVDEAVTSQARGDVDDEMALRELFATMDVSSKGYITRLALRNLLYRLDADGVAEEALLKAPEQITLPVFFKLFKQL